MHKFCREYMLSCKYPKANNILSALWFARNSIGLQIHSPNLGSGHPAISPVSQSPNIMIHIIRYLTDWDPKKQSQFPRHHGLNR